MSKNNDVVIIELDRPRELRFGHKALKKLTALFGKDVDEIMGTEEFELEDFEKIFFYGLEKDARANGETLTLEMMEDILDEAPSYSFLFDKMQEAFSKSFGSLTEGNLPAPVQAPKPNRAQRRASGTGKKA